MVFCFFAWVQSIALSIPYLPNLFWISMRIDTLDIYLSKPIDEHNLRISFACRDFNVFQIEDIC